MRRALPRRVRRLLVEPVLLLPLLLLLLVLRLPLLLVACCVLRVACAARVLLARLLTGRTAVTATPRAKAFRRQLLTVWFCWISCRGRKITKKGQKDLDLVATTLTAPASEW